MSFKIFNDPIHGHIELSSLACKVIDTPQFQRLRDISQLGGVYFVFPGASSNRFEHCLGVCYLARVFTERLRENQPGLISPTDALCVEIAALCHDLGHGPFSHLYDGKFLPKVLGNHDFKHEDASIAIIDLLISENDLYPEFERHGLNWDDVHFIKELILGDEEEAPKGFVWKGRGPGKDFLYDIVANKRNGIDVDKFDYFARDCHVLGLSKSFDAMRLMKFARVFPVERNAEGVQQSVNQTLSISTAVSSRATSEHTPSSSSSNTNGSQQSPHSGAYSQTTTKTEICYHVKEAWNILELFHTRYTLHKRAYQHRVSNAIELMIVEALCLADPYLTIPSYSSSNGSETMSEDPKMCRLSECPQDMNAYWRLGEYLLRVIENSVDSNLQPARAMIHRIRRRDLFGYAGETILTSDMMRRILSHAEKKAQNHQKEKMNVLVKRQLWEMLQEAIAIKSQQSEGSPTDLPELSEEDLFCSVVKVGYGRGNQNPLTNSTAFYRPNKSASLSSTGGDGQDNIEWQLGALPQGKNS